MIARLRGILQEKTTEGIVVDVQGVGYGLKVPLSTYGSLPATGHEVRLLVHTHVREDAITLFGFATPGEMLLFQRMIGVSGVGPRLAISLLSGLPQEDLVGAIRSGEVTRLCRVPGVGRKTAERLVVDLRDKLDALVGEPLSGGNLARPAAKEGDGAVLEDVLSALVNLGYSARDAEKALTDARRVADARVHPGVKPSFTFDGLLKEALRAVSGPR